MQGNFLNYLLNTEHPKIKFTFEKQVDNKFQF